MNILNLLKVVIATFLLLLIGLQTADAQLDPPIVENISVCEGESTLIVPMDPNGGGPPSPQVLGTEDFDSATGIGYTASIMFNDGVNDHFNLTDGTDIANTSGQYSFQDGTNMFWAAEDTDDNGGDGNDEQSIVFNAVNIAGFQDIQFCFDLAAGNTNPLGSNSYDASDYVTVQYAIDAAANQDGLCFNYFDNGDDFNEPLHHDLDCNGDGSDGPQIITTASQFCFTIPNMETLNANQVTFSILVYMDSAGEEIAFDDIEVTGTPIQNGTISFNYYDEDPAANQAAVPVATGANYDPMTTPATSPEMYWITTIDSLNESEATAITVEVFEAPLAEAGEDMMFCTSDPINLAATALPDGQSGQWTGGAGTFGNDTLAMTTYTPGDADLNDCVILTWTVTAPGCEPASDEVSLYIVEEAASAEFSYMMDTICPGDGVLLPMHDTGVDGFYQIASGDEDSLSLNSATGAIDIAASGMGTFDISNTVSSCGNLMITGVIDGPLSGGVPKAIELYAVSTVGNLSDYSLGSANNGGGTDGEEFMFPAGGIAQGTFIYVASDSIAFETFFGFKPDFVTPAALINGDDAIELFCSGKVIDLFGEIDIDGSGQSWDYLDGWAYRMDDATINTGQFVDTLWTYSGINALDGTANNASAAVPFPVGSFTTSYTGICENEVFTQTLTIGDFEAPVVICPSDMTISLDPGDCGTFAALPDPMAMDNCTDSLEFVYVSGPVNGDFLDKENSPYTVVYEATEDNGNVITCSYMITVEEYNDPTSTMACNGAINVSLDESCEALIGADALLEGGAYGCYEDYGVEASYNGQSVGTTVQNEYGTGYSVILDNSILNTPIYISIVDLETGNSCWGTVVIEDKLAPVIDSCTNLVLNCGDDISPIEPSVTENCSTVFFEMEEDIELGSCQDTFSSQITRIWVAIDAEGNASEPCTQVITVLKDSFDDLVFPLNYDGLTGNFDPLACDGAGVTFAVGENGLPSATSIGILPGTGEPSLGFGCSETISYYTDDVIPTCGIGYKVLRHWTVVDWCTGEVAEETQVIKVSDLQAPSFIGPEDITIAATPHCHGEYQLPLIPAIDNCGEASVYFTSEEGEIDNGYFRVDIVELNKAYQLSAVAVDDCGNEAAETFTVTFVDLTPPVVIAESSLTVTLSLDGTAKLYAESFDDGSYDGCSDIGFSVLRTFSTCPGQDYFPPAGDDNFQFNEVVHFCCADVGETQMVTFRVCDDADESETFGTTGDNCNIVMVEVEVQNKTAPIITCPPFMTVNCVDINGLDLTNNALMDELFGAASVQNACDGNLVQNALFNESCGAGIVIRTFIASNAAGVSTCSQAIAITQNFENTLTCDRISFTDLNNNVYDWCDVNDNNNDNDDDLPAIQIDCNDGFSIPSLDLNIEGLCTEVGESISVDTFNFAGGACKKYLLHYEVIDQCVFDENYVDPITGELDPYNSDNGYYEFFLEIDAFDNEGPDFNPEDKNFTADDCTSASISFTENATDACTDPAYIAYQYRVDLNNDDTIDFPTSGWADGSTISSNTAGLSSFPVGEHKIYWIVSDGCGNNETASQIITIDVNDKEPTPYCKTGLKASLSAMGMVMVSAADLDAGSFDNCTSQEDLIFSFSPDVTDTERTYTCDDLGFQFIQIYVTDLDGNQDFCNTSFLVQDNGDFCGSTIVVGEISSDNDYKNENATVRLDDIESQYNEVLTDEAGMYSMPISGASNAATLQVTDNNDILHGVTTFDIISIQKHILGLSVLESNSQLIAADVNHSESITGADIIEIRKVILGHKDYFTNNKSWVVYPATTDIEALVNPYDYPTEIILSETDNYDWKSIKVGDVNLSHTELMESNADTRSKFLLEFEVERTAEGQEISFFGDLSDLAGFELNLGADVVESYNEIISEAITIDPSDIGSQEQFKVIWYDLESSEMGDNHLFTLIVNSDFDVNSIIANTSSEAYIGRAAHTEVRTIVFRELLSAQGSEVLIYPNPFVDALNIDLSGFENSKSIISIFDVQGKLVYEMETEQFDLIKILSTNLNGAGVYYVQIENEDITMNKKVILIE